MKPFEYLEGITDADYAFKAYGKNLNELFVNSAMALNSAMVKSESVGETVVKEIVLENDVVEKLLFEFLEEIIFLKDAESLMMNSVKVEISGTYKLKAVFYGEELNLDKHEVVTDVKSVTYHHYKVEKVNDHWEATFVVDV